MTNLTGLIAALGYTLLAALALLLLIGALGAIAACMHSSRISRAEERREAQGEICSVDDREAS